MTGRLAAALIAALVVVPTAMADDDHHGSKKKHDELEISVVSSPAKYVSGGDARIEIAVPAKTDLDDVDVTLNGADVTSAFGPDPEGNHQLEGVVTGLPLGESRIVASSHKRGKGQKHRDELELVNNPLQGPIFSGPHQKVFLCATAGNAASNGLPPIPQSATCETPTVVSFIYRDTTGAWLPYNPASPPSPRNDRADDDDGREDGADDRPLGARHDQPLHLLDHDALAGLADRVAGLLGLERQA